MPILIRDLSDRCLGVVGEKIGNIMQGFIEKIGVKVPIVLAPMAGSAGPALAAAVCNAGGLGMLPVWPNQAAAVIHEMRAIRGLTPRPFGINLNNNYPQDEHLAAALDEGAAIISFFWGIHAERVRRAKEAGALVMQTVGTALEAKRAVDAGADVVVAQGWEAGGHVWSTVATLTLIPSVVDAVPSTPVVAAGGIADGRGLAAVLALGASAAWVGTRFLLAEEAEVAPSQHQLIIDANESDTVWGKDANPQWLDSGIRWIGRGGHGSYRPDGAQLAGQSVGLVNRLQPASEIVADLWREARESARALGRRFEAS